MNGLWEQDYMSRTLDKQSPLPLYFQLKSIMVERISAGTLKPNDQLPTEDEMARQFAVSKSTVRQALSELAGEGVVRRVQGRGTFVAEPRVEQGPRELTSFTDEMRKRGLRPSSKVLFKEVTQADAEIAEKLRLEEGQEVFHLRRLRYADAEVMGLQTSYVPISLVPDIMGEDFGTASLYEILEKKYGITFTHAQETHWAVLLELAEAELLAVPEGSPGLVAERIAFRGPDQPAEFVRSVMRGDRYKIILNLVK